jgi:hypothetical protein
MKRVLDCTRCKYFISCEPGKLAFATYYGCKEYEEKEENGKMEKETKHYEVTVTDDLSNVIVIGYNKDRMMTFINRLDPETLDECEQADVKDVCEEILKSLTRLSPMKICTLSEMDGEAFKNFDENVDANQFVEDRMKKRQEARETMGLEMCEGCKMGEICAFTMGAVKSPYKDTVKGMLSEDYKERFKAEYQQTKIRYEKLKAFCNRIEAAITTSHEGKKVDMPAHDCPYELLRTQQGHMGLYLHDLEIRAVIEGIEL